MICTNIGKTPLNLKSGKLDVGQAGEVTNAEFKFLFSQGRLEVEQAKPEPIVKPTPKKVAVKKKAVARPKAKSNG